jgi:hypothetical protein
MAGGESRSGMKIRRVERPVGVRVPPPAPSSHRFNAASHMRRRPDCVVNAPLILLMLDISWIIARPQRVAGCTEGGFREAFGLGNAKDCHLLTDLALCAGRAMLFYFTASCFEASPCGGGFFYPDWPMMKTAKRRRRSGAGCDGALLCVTCRSTGRGSSPSQPWP